MDQRAKLKQDHTADMAWEASQLSEARRDNHNRANYIDELNSEINDLKDELLKASGREEALHAVIQVPLPMGLATSMGLLGSSTRLQSGARQSRSGVPYGEIIRDKTEVFA